MKKPAVASRLLRAAGLGVLLLAAAPVVFRIAAALRETRTPVPPEGRLVAAGDVRLYVQELGPADGPIVLFTHGMGAWSGLWRPILEPVAAAGIRCVAVDLPPFGFSERPANGDYSRAAQAVRLWALADSLGARRASLVGHSFGSGAVAEAALAVPERVDKLVLIAPALGLDAAAGPPSPLARALLAWRPLRQMFVASTLANPLLVRRGLAGFMERDEAATPERVAILRRPQRAEGYVRGVGEWVRGFVLGGEVTPSFERAAYARLAMPVLLIWGDRDATTPLAQGAALNRSIPGSELVVLPGIGHMPQLEETVKVQELLIRFLAPKGPAG